MWEVPLAESESAGRFSSSSERRRVEAGSRGCDCAVEGGSEERLGWLGTAQQIVPILGADRPEAAVVGGVAAEGGGGLVAGRIGVVGAQQREVAEGAAGRAASGAGGGGEECVG